MKTITIKSTPKVFLNKDFKTIQIKVIFPFYYNEDSLAKLNILPGMLHNVCNKYPTEKEFSEKIKSLYILACFCTLNTIGDIGYFTFNFMIPDNNSFNKNLLDEQIKFLSEVIYNPKHNNNSFYSQELEREIKSLKLDIDKIMKDPGSYAMIKAKEVVDPNGRFSSSLFNHIDQIDKVNTNNLYDFYKEYIYNNQPLIYVFGNCKKNEIINLCNKYLYKNNFNIKYQFNIKNYLKINNKTITHTDISNFNNSISIMFYKVRNMTKKDEILLGLVQELLSSLSSRLLNKKLRDEYELVYSSYASSYSNYGVLGIVAFIEKKNIKLVREKINEVLLSLKDTNLISPLLDNIKNRHRIGLIRLLDDKLSLFDDYIIKDLDLDLTNNERYEIIKNITPSMISSFVDRLVLDTDYFLKEGEHE